MNLNTIVIGLSLLIKSQVSINLLKIDKTNIVTLRNKFIFQVFALFMYRWI